ncbi:MAG: GNAT family N-acetyltransferase [Polyangiaceae bacterium]|nr:GNAT family N-acetyltransferase [Polyangiaceae bacterium]
MRELDLTREDPRCLIPLKEAVYGKKISRPMFEWQYLRHPNASDMHIFVVEKDGFIVASTTRFPARFLIRGTPHAAYFNIDSMVHPEHRRRGKMRELYLFARQHIAHSPLFFSKGSSSTIIPLLLSIHHRTLAPNTYLVNYPSVKRWILSRMGRVTHVVESTVEPPSGFSDFQPVRRFGAEFNAFFERIAPAFPGIFWRDAEYMNWRYVDFPARRYACFARQIEGRTVAVLVVSIDDVHSRIVDLLWDPAWPGEPLRTVRFVRALAKKLEFVRLACFATHPELRAALEDQAFYDRGETPRFSAFVPPSCEETFDRSWPMHVVDGDGDTEFS